MSAAPLEVVADHVRAALKSGSLAHADKMLQRNADVW